MDSNLWQGEAELVDGDGRVVAHGHTRIEELLNPAGTWHGRLLADEPELRLANRHYSLRSTGEGWTALVEQMRCEPAGDGHDTTVEFRGVSAWPVESGRRARLEN